jgi:hypothetical protein
VRPALAAAALVAAAVGVGGARAARAAGGEVLPLVLEGCPDIDEVRLRELLVIELGTVRPEGARGIDVRIACGGPRVAVELHDGALGRSWRAEVDLAAAPEATRLRLLVLAVTEQWSLGDAVAPPPEPPRVAPAAIPVVARAPAPPADQPWRLQAGAVARRAGRPGLWLGGGGAGVERALGRRLGVALDVAAEGGELATSVARVTVRELVGTASLVARADAGRWSLSAAPGFSVGLASLAASPLAADARGATLDAAWAGPVLAGRVRLALGRSAALAAGAGAGFTTRRVTGLVDGQTALLELRGPWLVLDLGAAWSF